MPGLAGRARAALRSATSRWGSCGGCGGRDGGQGAPRTPRTDAVGDLEVVLLPSVCGRAGRPTRPHRPASRVRVGRPCARAPQPSSTGRRCSGDRRARRVRAGRCRRQLVFRGRGFAPRASDPGGNGAGGRPGAAAPVAGRAETIAVVGLLVGLAEPWSAVAAAAGLVVFFAIAVGVHLRARDLMIGLPLGFLLPAAGVVVTAPV
ncbi:DoxX family protein [Actinophytocola sp. KF-1]